MVFPRAEPEGKPSSQGETFHQDTHTGMVYLFYYTEQTQFGKISMTAGRSSENGGRFSSGHFAGGHDGMANLCKPITAYDFHVRYNNVDCLTVLDIHSIMSMMNEAYLMLMFDIALLIELFIFHLFS